jgi:hypothetical protein
MFYAQIVEASEHLFIHCFGIAKACWSLVIEKLSYLTLEKLLLSYLAHKLKIFPSDIWHQDTSLPVFWPKPAN